jgi:hypothetical protein
MVGVILAAGASSRFSGFPKQLLVVEGETLLDRQVRMFAPHAEALYLVTHREELTHADVQKFCPVSHRWKCDTLLSAWPLWRDQDSFILHGDVYFTEPARQEILKHYSCPTFFWDGQEVFALRIPPESGETIEKNLKRVVHDTAAQSSASNDAGLASLFTACQALGDKVQTVAVADWTQDFDTPEEYDGWRIGWRKNKLWRP